MSMPVMIMVAMRVVVATMCMAIFSVIVIMVLIVVSMTVFPVIVLTLRMIVRAVIVVSMRVVVSVIRIICAGDVAHGKGGCGEQQEQVFDADFHSGFSLQVLMGLIGMSCNRFSIKLKKKLPS